MGNGLDNLLHAFAEGRTKKPRQIGTTIVRDTGLGLNQTDDLVRVCGDYIDGIKLDHGMEVLCGKTLIKGKLDLCRDRNIDTMPGENILEIAIWNEIHGEYLDKAAELGFTTMCIPSSTIAMRKKVREDVMNRCLRQNFKVISIAGRRHPEEELSFPVIFELISDDLNMGAYKVLIKAEEHRNGFGICDRDGHFIRDQVLRFLDGVDHPDRLIWEAPRRHQQQDLIYHLGLNVNLDGIAPDSVLALESLRRGLIGEAEKKVYLEHKYWEDLKNA
jgi:phosphosulfolactate synthase